MARLTDVREIASVPLLIAKAVLFVTLGGVAAALLLAKSPELTTLLLLALCVWAFARGYYFLFYVIEHYVDPSFRYSGIGSALLHLWRRGRAHRIAR
jgi:ribosomal protein S18 acetylase RimI-like enzyme